MNLDLQVVENCEDLSFQLRLGHDLLSFHDDVKSLINHSTELFKCLRLNRGQKVWRHYLERIARSKFETSHCVKVTRKEALIMLCRSI
jgi:hypothetical protein